MSKNTPVDLEYQRVGGAIGALRVETFLQEASPHVARWRSLSIASLSGRGEALALLPTKPVHNLEELELIGFDHPEIRSIDLITITIGDAAFPKLKNIRISNAPVTIHATAFTTLRSFVLMGKAGSSLREIVGVLQNSPQLERLELWHCKRLEIAEQDWSVHPIMFERLTAVKLEKLHASVTNFILSIVHAPNCTRLIIISKIADPPLHLNLFNASISHLLLPFKEARYGHGGAEQSIMVEAPTPLKSIKLQCGGPPPDLLIRKIQEILSDVEITYV
ncbi:hypothetical protein FRC04_011558 [Tulasnella sp. 424]|nr:hypothetical protein FRC04_011558 [Tulasnella sp. 424]